MKSKITLNTEKLRREKKLKKIFKISLLMLTMTLLITYLVIGIIYNNGNFSISLDRNLYFEKGLIIYDDPEYKVYRSELHAKVPNTFDNISYKWLPDDLDNNQGGSNNGDNYLVYTFYIENIGEKVSDYWSELIIDDVIKNVDEAVRIRVYKNGKSVTYAKKDARGKPEPNTTPFESEHLVVREKVANFKPGDKNKYTIVLWIEGSDPDCTDNILGGEFKVYMEFNSEYVED